MGKTGKIILTVAIIFGAFLLASFMVGGDGGAMKTVINNLIGIINGWVDGFTQGNVVELIPPIS